MNDDVVAVGISDDCHMAAGTFEPLGCEGNLSILQVLNGLIEVLDFQRRARSLIGRHPLRTDTGDGKRVIAKRILHPLSAHHFFRNFQPEHAFIKCTCPFHVRDRRADESEIGNFHNAIK